MEPATFWLVAQCLNELRHHVPKWRMYNVNIMVLQGMINRLIAN